MKQIVSVPLTGNIDRRNFMTKGDGVLSRENFLVIGDKTTKRVKKISGADRFNSTAVGTTFVSGIRYYTKKEVRRTFAYNTDGYLYYFDENGNTTQLIGVFSPLAHPCFENFRVSDNDILYFSEGVSTGMYSFDNNIGNQFNKETAVTLNLVDMVSWLDRLWGFEEDEEALNYSKNLVPTNFTDSTDAGTVIIGAKRGAKQQRVIVINDTLYIFKTDSIWRVVGRTPSEFQVELVHDSLGLASRWSLQVVEGGAIFQGSDYEMYSFGGTKESTTLLTYNVALGGDLTKDLAAIVNKNKMADIKSCFHNKFYRMSFTESGKSTNNMEYIFNTVNQSDSFSRDFNISCYIPFDRFPDKGELLTGRVGEGRLMKMNQGLNVDNQATSPTMPYKIQSKFIGQTEPRNMRVRAIWGTFGVLARPPVPIRMYIDARTAASDASSDELIPYGEYKSQFTSIQIASQGVVTSRYIPKHANSKCQNFSLEINETKNNRELEFGDFQCQVILNKNLKRSFAVGV